METLAGRRPGVGALRRSTRGGSPARKTLEEFDFTFQRSVRFDAGRAVCGWV
jgi:hypothetical protein